MEVAMVAVHVDAVPYFSRIRPWRHLWVLLLAYPASTFFVLVVISHLLILLLVDALLKNIVLTHREVYFVALAKRIRTVVI